MHNPPFSQRRRPLARPAAHSVPPPTISHLARPPHLQTRRRRQGLQDERGAYDILVTELLFAGGSARNWALVSLRRRRRGLRWGGEDEEQTKESPSLTASQEAARCTTKNARTASILRLCQAGALSVPDRAIAVSGRWRGCDDERGGEGGRRGGERGRWCGGRSRRYVYHFFLYLHFLFSC